MNRFVWIIWVGGGIRDVAEDPAADPDDPDKAVHEHGQETTPPHDDRQREPDAEGDEEEIAVRGGCHGEHIVEAHDRVSQDDDPDRLPERAALTDVLLGPGLLADELERDPEEQQPADELEHRDREEQRRDGDEGQTEPHRTRRAPHAPPELLARRSEEHTSELQSRLHLVCRLLLEKKKKRSNTRSTTSHADTTDSTHHTS